jgi:site-specific DNA-cytosine methylase
MIKDTDRRTDFDDGEGHTFYKCCSVEPTGRVETVYNISVEDDESYVADGIVVHNCTEISRSGKRQGLKGEHSGLAWETVRLLSESEHKPQILLMENNPPLLSEYRHQFDELVDSLSELGYTTFTRLLKAQDFGVPQMRERVFAVSVLGKKHFEFPSPIPLTRTMFDCFIPPEEVSEALWLTDAQIATLRRQASVFAQDHIPNRGPLAKTVMSTQARHIPVVAIPR